MRDRDGDRRGSEGSRDRRDRSRGDDRDRGRGVKKENDSEPQREHVKRESTRGNDRPFKRETRTGSNEDTWRDNKEEEEEIEKEKPNFEASVQFIHPFECSHKYPSYIICTYIRQGALDQAETVVNGINLKYEAHIFSLFWTTYQNLKYTTLNARTKLTSQRPIKVMSSLQILADLIKSGVCMYSKEIKSSV